MHGRKRHDRQAESRGEPMHDVDADLGVPAQGLALATTHRLGEGGEVSTKPKDAGAARGDYEIADGPGAALVALDEAKKRPPHSDDLLEHIQREAMRGRRFIFHP